MVVRFRGCQGSGWRAGWLAWALCVGLVSVVLPTTGCKEMKPPPGAEESATDLEVDMGGEAKDEAPEEPVAPKKEKAE